ncbi:probable protein phosphatase 2C 37 [Triticum aestivum]|uniref:probable protein phosphatase 2C 37 n=1 Tax=Triticum aestivum TaxID=4565 RepID=UPI001D029E0A|nr:probable protein phosphatase 2C 37 [Triticum aestivum]
MTTRSEDDDCLILASDGLWDVIKNQIACNAVRNCLEFENKNNQGAPREGALIGQEEEVGCNNAATLLKNMAICKHSQDDISVVVLDLKARGLVFAVSTQANKFACVLHPPALWYYLA